MIATAEPLTPVQGIMVCDSHGSVLAANSRLKEIVSPEGARWDPASRCCNLLGCGASPGPLEGSCLTERSLAAEQPLVGVRVEPRGVTPLMVTATPVCDAGSQVVFEVRRESGPAIGSPALRIFALGAFRVEGRDGSLTGDWLSQRPGELLRFLVCERRRIVPADMIGEAIWPHVGAAAPNTVRHFVHALRYRLEPGLSDPGCRSTVVCRRGGYGLDPERVWFDVDEFERQAVAGAVTLNAGRRRAATEHLERAMALYRGDFMADEPYAEWALRERDRLRAVASEVLRGLIQLATGPDTARYLEELAELEPFDDDVHRELISAWLLMGRRSQAARRYESFRTRLLRQFGARPGFELAELAQAVEPRRCA